MHTNQTEKPFEIQVLELTEWKQRPQQNNFFEIVYILKGEGGQCINYNNYRYQEGSIFLLPPLKCHSFTIESPTQFIFLKFNNQFFNKKYNHSSNFEEWFKEASYILANYQQTPGELIGYEKDKLHLISLIQIILHESQQPNDNTLDIIISLMVSILHIVLRNIKHTFIETVDQKHDKRLTEITNYIQDNICNSKQLKIEVLAEKFAISRYYMSEYFKKQMGMPLKEYILRSKLKLVEIRLLCSDYNINQIADELGFSDSSHLARTFKKYSHQSIKEFRNKGDYYLLKKERNSCNAS